MIRIYFHRHLNELPPTHPHSNQHVYFWLYCSWSHGLAHRRIGRPVTMKIDQGQRETTFSNIRVRGGECGRRRKIHKTRRICVDFSFI